MVILSCWILINYFLSFLSNRGVTSRRIVEWITPIATSHLHHCQGNNDSKAPTVIWVCGGSHDKRSTRKPASWPHQLQGYHLFLLLFANPNKFNAWTRKQCWILSWETSLGLWPGPLVTCYDWSASQVFIDYIYFEIYSRRPAIHLSPCSRNRERDGKLWPLAF